MSHESRTEWFGFESGRLAHELRVMKALSVRWGREVKDSIVGLSILLIAQPLIWYVLFGGLFKQLTALPGFPVTSYSAYILPGIAMLISLGYITTGGMCIIEDFRDGILQKMWSAPISKFSIIGGRILIMAILSTTQVSFLVLLAYADGVRFAAGAVGVVLVLLMTAAFTAGVTALSLSIAYLLHQEFAFNAVTSFAVLPVIFASNAFIPIDMMPEWIAAIALVNPVTITINGLRAAVIDGLVLSEVGPALVLLVGFDVLAVLVAALTFRLNMERESVFLELCKNC